MFIKRIGLFLLAFFTFIFIPFSASAAQIENLSATPIAGDYIIGPGKNELWLDPGKNETRNMTITNRYGRDMEFKIQLEDFKGSKVPGENIILLGSEKGPYSLKDFLRPEMTSFVLKHGQRLTLPVLVQVPADAQPGGLYGSVIVTAEPSTEGGSAEDKVVSGNLTVVSRLASLFFVRVSGQANESGQVVEFNSSKYFYTEPKVAFTSVYENSGNVYLDPYGVVQVKNAIGTKVDEIKIDPYFVMPDATRSKEVVLSNNFLFGYYRATMMLNRGYGNIIDEKTVSFWVLPWKQTAVGLLVVALAVIGLLLVKKWFNKNFERKPKA